MTAGTAILLAALAFAGCLRASDDYVMSAVQKKTSGLLRERLSFAPRIAWIKYQGGRPIEDNAREAILLNNLEEAGRKQGLEPGRVREFFSAQMAAFQQVQREEIASWRAGAPAPAFAPMDLQAEIRPAIENLNSGLLALLSDPGAGPSPAFARACERVLRDAGFSAAASKLAAGPLASSLPWKAP